MSRPEGLKLTPWLSMIWFAELLAHTEALREAKPAIVIGPIPDEMRAAALEKLRAAGTCQKCCRGDMVIVSSITGLDGGPLQTRAAARLSGRGLHSKHLEKRAYTYASLR
jgi:hypothetical protein